MFANRDQMANLNQLASSGESLDYLSQDKLDQKYCKIVSLRAQGR